MTNLHAHSQTYWALVPAAGMGTRMGAENPKQYLSLHGKSVLEHSLTVLATHPKINKVVVVLNSADKHWQNLSLPFADKILTVMGGTRRSDSVWCGLQTLQQNAKANDWILVHDAVRPCCVMRTLIN